MASEHDCENGPWRFGADGNGTCTVCGKDYLQFKEEQVVALKQQLAQVTEERDTLVADLRQRQQGQTSAEQQLKQARENEAAWEHVHQQGMADLRQVVLREHRQYMEARALLEEFATIDAHQMSMAQFYTLQDAYRAFLAGLEAPEVLLVLSPDQTGWLFNHLSGLVSRFLPEEDKAFAKQIMVEANAKLSAYLAQQSKKKGSKITPAP